MRMVNGSPAPDKGSPDQLPRVSLPMGVELRRGEGQQQSDPETARLNL